MQHAVLQQHNLPKNNSRQSTLVQRHVFVKRCERVDGRGVWLGIKQEPIKLAKKIIQQRHLSRDVWKANVLCKREGGRWILAKHTVLLLPKLLLKRALRALRGRAERSVLITLLSLMHHTVKVHRCRYFRLHTAGLAVSTTLGGKHSTRSRARSIVQRPVSSDNVREGPRQPSGTMRPRLKRSSLQLSSFKSCALVRRKSLTALTLAFASTAWLSSWALPSARRLANIVPTPSLLGGVSSCVCPVTYHAYQAAWAADPTA